MEGETKPRALEAPTEELRWLVEGPGRSWLDRLRQDDRPLHELTRHLRRDLSAGQVALLLEQRDLRRRALAKFPDAERLFFTRRSLEQATDATLAAYKATRFPPRSPVVDACCGIGGDLMALAARGPVVGIESDPLPAYLAQANLRELGIHESEIRVDRVPSTPLPAGTALHLDPDRRPGERRSVRLEAHSPNDREIELLLRQHHELALKLAPATEPEHALLARAELEWMGHQGTCQQLVAWFGTLAREPGVRTATWLVDGRPHHWSAPHTLPVTCTQQVDPFVYEPVASLLAAGLAGNLAETWGLKGLTPGGGYLTGPRCHLFPWAESYEVLESMPFRPDRVQAWLRGREVGSVEVKKRNVELDPAKLQRAWTGPGSEAAVVFLTRFGPRIVALITRRIPPVVDPHA